MTVTAVPLTESIREKALPITERNCWSTKKLRDALKKVSCDGNKLERFFQLKNFAEREEIKELTKLYDKSENDLKALQSVGQIVGEVLKQLTEDKCKFIK